MNEYKYRELDLAERIYRCGFQTNHLPSELRLLALYLKTVLGLRPRQVKSKLEEFLQKQMPDYSQEKYYPLINRALRQTAPKDSRLIQIEELPVWQEELDYIRKVPLTAKDGVILAEDYNCRKLLFAFLVEMRLVQTACRLESLPLYFKGDKKRYTELQKTAKIPDQVSLHETLIHCLDQAGLVQILFGGMLRLCFLEELETIPKSVFHQEPALRIRNLTSYGWYFDYANSRPRIRLCSACSQPFRPRTNRQIYCCEECAKEAGREAGRIRIRRYREGKAA